MNLVCRHFISIWIVLLISLAMALSVRAENEVYLYLPSGTVQSFDINTVQKITFSEQVINFHFKSPNENIQTISYDTVISFNKRNSAIETIEFENIHFSIQHPYINIESDDIIMEISVYDLQGLQVINETVYAPSTSLSLESVGSGVYIICISTRHRMHNIKVVK